MGMDQYLLIPFLGGWTSIYQLFWCSPVVQGFDTLPYFSWYNHIYVHEWLNDPMLQAIWQRTWAIYKPSAHEMFLFGQKTAKITERSGAKHISLSVFFLWNIQQFTLKKKPPLSAHFSAKKLPEGGIIPGCQMAGFGVAGTLDAP